MQNRKKIFKIGIIILFAVIGCYMLVSLYFINHFYFGSQINSISISGKTLEEVDEEVERLIGRFAEQMKMQGISLDLYYQFTGSSEKELRANMEKEAYNNVLYRLMLEEIMTLEKIEVTEEEAEKEAEALAEKYQMDKNDFLAQFGGIDMIQYDLEIRKVMELLKELNK